MAGSGMTSKHRQILREQYEFLIENLHADHVLQKMKDIFTKYDEQDIKSKPTERKRAEELIDTLPRKGGQAFQRFVEVLSVVQPWLAEYLAALGGISLLPSQDLTGKYCKKGPAGMDKQHQDVLRKYVEEFKKKLDVEDMVKSLVKEGVLHDDFARQQILHLTEKSKQIEKLMLDILPKSGHEAFEKFCFCLAKQQPQFAYEWKSKVKESHPNVDIDLGTSYQESDRKASFNSDMNVSSRPPSSNSTMTLLSPCSQLPEEVKTILKDALDKPPDELYDNDWKLLYKTLQLPEGKENVILTKAGSPTSHIIDTWTRAKGKQATLKCLLSALQICHHGHLVEQIEEILGVEYKEETDMVAVGQNVAVGIG